MTHAVETALSERKIATPSLDASMLRLTDTGLRDAQPELSRGEQRNLTYRGDIDLPVYYINPIYLTSSTAVQQDELDIIQQRVDMVFEAAEDEEFEDGMDSKFSRELVSIVRRYGILAMQEISYLIIYQRINSEVASEGLRCLARIDHELTHSWRLWLLEKCINSDSPQVRDGASLGLASLSDIHAIPFLKQAISRETYVELRNNIQQVLGELEALNHAASSEKNRLS